MIIGLTGGKGCGKSTVAKIINKLHDYEIISFATPIKDMLRVLGLGDAELNDPTIKEIVLDEYGKTPREMMQSLGTEWGRMLVSGMYGFPLFANSSNLRRTMSSMMYDLTTRQDLSGSAEL